MNSFDGTENNASSNNEHGFNGKQSNFQNNQNYNQPQNSIPPVRPIQINKGNNGCLMAVIFTLGFFAIFIFGGVYLLSSGAEVVSKVFDEASGSMTISSKENMFNEEIHISGDSSQRIVVIPVTGAIFGWGNATYGAGTVYKVSSLLDRAANDDTVKAVILQIDSPGGGLSASDIIYHELLKLKKKNKKVIVYVGQLCASGGYYIAAPADYIVAGPTSLVGSFGVIMQHVEVTGLLEKIGVVVDPIKSTNSKDIGSPFKKLSEKDREYFDHILSTYHNRFIDIITKGRKLDRDKVASLADGKVYLATEALDYGLIDEIGYFDASLDQAKKYCTVDYPEIFSYKHQMSLIDLLNAESKSNLPSSINEFLNENSGTDISLIYRGFKNNK